MRRRMKQITVGSAGHSGERPMRGWLLGFARIAVLALTAWALMGVFK
jgi:hypothetical protein